MKKAIRIIAAALLCCKAITYGAEIQPRIGINTTLATDYVARDGSVIGEGPINQNSVSASIDSITAFVWDSYDLSENQEKERDYGIVLSSSEIDGLDGKLSGNISYQKWLFPEAQTEEDMIEIQGRYSGDVNAQITLSLQNADLDLDSFMVYSSINKCITIDNNSISVIPQISASYLDDFFGATGFGHITPSISAREDIAGFTIEIKIAYQIGDHKPSQQYYALSISTSL
ncbi:hypothetical protein H6503_06510 [Candidatus Woesearchaeota archaeon]|nr:hypothetical protein [Candidatus Woesearchaeota archaeon]